MDHTVVNTSVKYETERAEAAAIRRFIELQARLLDYYGVKATSRFVELAEPRMRAHLLEAGAGEPVLFLHGGDGEGVNWAPVMGTLQSTAHLYAVDRPGFGLSDAFDYRTVDLRTHAVDFVTSLLDALGLESATLVGGSMGGFFTLATALAHPERVRGIVLVGAALGTTKQMGQQLQTICGTPGAPEAFMANLDNLDAQHEQYRDMFKMDLTHFPDLYFEARIAGLRLPSEKGTWATLLKRVATLEGIRPELYLGEELHRITAPTLVLWGEDDLAPPSMGRAATDAIPGSRFETIMGIGHFPYLEAPESCARLIAEFLAANRQNPE